MQSSSAQNKTVPRASTMPARGNSPGLKGGRFRPELGKRLPYWYAKQVVRDTMGFPDQCIPLPPDADDGMLSTLCQEHTARLLAWIDERKQADEQEPELAAAAKLRYDGSVYSASQIYQRHPRSRFHRVKHNTRASYVDSLEIVEATVGKRLIRNLTVLDCEHWYEEWRKPAIIGKDEKGLPIFGPERVKRAHGAISIFKTVLRFNAALRRADCKQLLEELKLVKFEKGGARLQEMTYPQAATFVHRAIEFGERGLLPVDQALRMAIGVAAQFELGLRQMDIIGEWRPGNAWAGMFIWENIPGWRWRMKTSKSKYRATATFDLTLYPLLFPLLEAVPHGERRGPIVYGENGEPIRYTTYRKRFRRIARAAGIPDEVWSMDARAGAATEAEEAGVEIAKIRDVLTHSESRTTARYIRRQERAIADVARARSRMRSGEDGGGTG